MRIIRMIFLWRLIFDFKKLAKDLETQNPFHTFIDDINNKTLNYAKL